MSLLRLLTAEDLNIDHIYDSAMSPIIIDIRESGRPAGRAGLGQDFCQWSGRIGSNRVENSRKWVVIVY